LDCVDAVGGDGVGVCVGGEEVYFDTKCGAGGGAEVGGETRE